jgi:hypothetical protein
MARHLAVGLGASLLVLMALVGDHRDPARAAPAPSGAIADATAAPVPPLSGILPVVVDLPPSAPSPEAVRPNFDDFSWRSFIALMWPAQPGRHGVPRAPNRPSVFLKAGGSYQTVWGTYREANELYGSKGRPVPFGSSSATPSVCGNTAPGTKVLLMAAKSGTLLQDVDQAFSYPLVDQSNNYVYYEIRFNRDQYEFVRGKDKEPTTWLYLAKNLQQAEMKAPIAMPISAPKPYREGAVMLKAAWKQLTAADNASRYYSVKARIYDTAQTPPGCRDATMGLIGFHIGHKVADFPQWVWSSFEQVDNVPPDDGSKPPAPMTLNNGTNDPPTDGGWANRPASKHLVPPAERIKAQVTRLNKIPTTPPGQSTVDINARYRALLSGTVWANYQLVITQWPAAPVPQAQFKPKENQGIYPQDAGGPFPVADAVNTALETFFQSPTDAAGAGGNSCMQCHYGAGDADFSWSLVLRSK